MAYRLILALLLVLAAPLAFGQDAAPEEDDGSSEKVEQRDDSYRRQMELEDARSKDRTYIDNTYTPSADLEKIDKLPEESRDNIRDQLVDVIMENGEWEPSDILEEYPYSPSAGAQSDPELAQQEQEAWDEQIEKYHEREANAFGAHRGPVPGPGNPAGQEGGQAGDGSQQGQQGAGKGGQPGSGGKEGDGKAGTYQPGKPGANGSDDEVSTEGVSESALDFLRGGRGRQQPPPGTPQADQQAPAAQSAQAEQSAADQQAQAEQAATEQNAQTEQAAETSPDQQAQESRQEAAEDVPLDTRGIIAIKDLDKLEGTGGQAVPEDEEEEEP
jgi:hypothetical protein